MDRESPSKLVRWPLVRVAAGHDVVCELLSGEWLRLSTHFWKRTLVCAEGDDCPLCPLLPVRPFWYLPVLVEPSRRPGLLELSAHASADLEQVAKFSFGSVGSGFRVRLTRRSKRAPMRCEALESSASARGCHLHDWGSCLMAIYGLPPLREFETLEAYGLRVRERVRERAAVTAALLAGPAEERRFRRNGIA